MNSEFNISSIFSEMISQPNLAQSGSLGMCIYIVYFIAECYEIELAKKEE